MFNLNILAMLFLLIFCLHTIGYVSIIPTETTNDYKIFVASVEQFNDLPTIATHAYDYLKQSQNDKQITRFIFVRHGQSTSNQEKSIAGRTLDVDLSEDGVSQASTVGVKLKDCGLSFDSLYCSPSLRTQRTMQLILNQIKCKQPIHLDDRLYEKFYGPYEGATEKEYFPVKKAEEIDNSGPERSFEDKFSFKFHPDMESMADVHSRIVVFLQESYLKHLGENVLIATHNGVMKALFMDDAAKRGFDVDYRSFDLNNCSVLIIEVEEGNIRLVASHGLKFKANL
jgi:broad specificity phosphatase PhoE